MKYAYIFDVDGVLINTMEAHFACYKQALEEVNVPIDKAQFFRQAGMKGQEQIKYFAEKAGIVVDAGKVYQRKRELFDKWGEDVNQIECNVELICALKAAGFPVAMASGSARASWVRVVEKIGIHADAVVGAEDVSRGKPHPDLFLCAAAKLRVPPENCIVIEDSDVGIEAAVAAGMKVMRFCDNSETQ
jgi:beta-phosphoglucomutase